MTLGQKILSLRTENNLSQKELAIIVDVPTGKIAEWEADEVTLSLSDLSKLSKALSVSADVLLSTVSASEPEKSSSACVNSAAPQNRRRSKVIIIVLVTALVLAVIAAVYFLCRPYLSEITIPTDSSAAQAFSQDSSAIEAADASVITIFCYNHNGELSATGSGFIAFDSKTVITNYHVMTSAYICKISTNQDISYNVSAILCYSKDKDIAILQLEKDTNLVPLSLGDSTDINKGEPVVAIGSPLGIKNTVSTGVLSSRIMERNMDILQFTAPISDGSSGGALFDDNGNVIGITYASYTNGQNLNLAIPIELAKELYQSKHQSYAVSAIYEEQYPYLKYLDSYNSLIDVTLADLRINPKKYNGKTIRLETFISSEDIYTDLDLRLYYIANQENVSLDIDYDIWLCCSSGLPYSKITVMLCCADFAKYVDSSIKPGSNVVVIGIFSYHEAGDPIHPDDPDSGRYYYWDGGDILAELIYPVE